MIGLRLSLVALCVLVILGLMVVLGSRSRVEARAASESLMYAKGMRIASASTISGVTGVGENLMSVEQTRGKPGYIVGTVTDSSGNPLEDAHILVFQQPDESHKFPAVDAYTDSRGYYEVQLSKGAAMVSASAYYEVDYNGNHYTLQLDPTDKSVNGWFLGESSPVKDFVWRIYGERPSDTIQVGDPNVYYGGTLYLDDEYGYRSKVLNQYFAHPPTFPRGSKIEIDYAADTPLIDGEPAPDLQFITVGLPQGSNNRYIFNLPIGHYQIAAWLLLPDGTATRLYVVAVPRTRTTSQAPQPAPVAEFDFQPETPSGIQVEDLYLMYPPAR